MEILCAFSVPSSGAVSTSNSRLAAVLGGAKASGRRDLSLALPDGTTLVGKDVYFTVGKDGQTVTLFPKRTGGWALGTSFESTVTL